MDSIRKFFARFRRVKVSPSPDSKLYSNPEQADILEWEKEMKAASRIQRKMKGKKTGSGGTGNKSEEVHRIRDTVRAIETGAEVRTEMIWKGKDSPPGSVQSLTPDESKSPSIKSVDPPVDTSLDLEAEGTKDQNDNLTTLCPPESPILDSDSNGEKENQDNKLEGSLECPVHDVVEKGPESAKRPDPEVRSWVRSDTLSDLFPETDSCEFSAAVTDIWVKNTIFWNERIFSDTALSSAEMEKEIHDIVILKEIQHLVPPRKKYSVKMKLKDASFYHGTSDHELEDYMDLLWSPAEAEVIAAISQKNGDTVAVKPEKFKSWKFDPKTRTWKKTADEGASGKTSLFGSAMKGLRWIGHRIRPKKSAKVAPTPRGPVIRQKVRIIRVPSDMTISTPLSDLDIGPDGQRIMKRRIF